MVKKVPGVILLITVVLLSGCTAIKHAFVPQKPSAEKGSVVYVYRPSTLSNVVVSPVVKINGDEKFAIGNDDYTFVYLQPGDYTFELDLDKDYGGNKKITMNIEPNQTYYLKIETALKFKEGEPYERRFDIERAEPVVAAAEIAYCRFIKPQMPSKYLYGENGDGNGDPGPEPEFSIDKSTNPFPRKF